MRIGGNTTVDNSIVKGSFFLASGGNVLNGATAELYSGTFVGDDGSTSQSFQPQLRRTLNGPQDSILCGTRTVR